jgi:hypothetical protein
MVFENSFDEGIAGRVAQETGCRLDLVQAITPLVCRFFIRTRSEIVENASADVFLKIMFPDLAKYIRASRSVASRMGSQFYPALAKNIATIHFGADELPQLIRGKYVTPEAGTDLKIGHSDVILLSVADKDDVETTARLLEMEIRTKQLPKIGTEEFAERLQKENRRLTSAISSKNQVWSTRSDLYIKSVGLIELESSGQLDSSNVTAQIQKLLRAGLIHPNPTIKLFWGLTYNNKGDDAQEPSTSLKRYLDITTTTDSQGGMLVGRRFWEALLPDDVSYEKFLEVVEEIVKEVNKIEPSGMEHVANATPSQEPNSQD